MNKGRYGYHFNRYGSSDMYCDLEGYQLLELYCLGVESGWQYPLTDEVKTASEWKQRRQLLTEGYALFPQNPNTWIQYVGDLCDI
jgi:hypothetical protein